MGIYSRLVTLALGAIVCALLQEAPTLVKVRALYELQLQAIVPVASICETEIKCLYLYCTEMASLSQLLPSSP